MEKYINNIRAKIIKYIEENKYFDIDDCFKDCVAPNICKRATVNYFKELI